MQMTKLRFERIRRGWTQQQLAEQVGITKSAIHKIETLQRKPSYDVLMCLQVLLNLHDGELLEQVTDEDLFSQ